jgi:hypothetical protein
VEILATPESVFLERGRRGGFIVLTDPAIREQISEGTTDDTLGARVVLPFGRGV